jgi:IPT/TIG domain
MSRNLTPTLPAATDPTPTPMTGGRLINWLGASHIAIALILLYFLFKIWPPVPWPGTKENPEYSPITFLGLLGERISFQIYTSLDERLILLVIVAGALGSFIHSATSFSDYVGNRKFVSSWAWWYVLRSFVGIALALILYFVVRAGFVTAGADAMSPFGVATLAALAGLFSKQATDKLEEVFTTMFRPAPGKGDAKRGDKLSGPTISGIAPREGPTTGGTEVTIVGSGFVDKASVKFGDQPADPVVFVNATTLKATTPAHAAGDVEVIVANPDGQEGSPRERFTYVDGGGGATNGSDTAATTGTTAAITAAAAATTATATAEDETVETIDGCDVDIIEETPDVDLPMAEGGVE